MHSSYYDPPPHPPQPQPPYPPSLSSAALLPSPPLHIPPALNRPRLKRAFSSSDPPLEPSHLGAIEESQWGEAQAERLDGGWTGRASWDASGGITPGQAGERQSGLGLRVGGEKRGGVEDYHQSKRYKADIAPHFASLSLQPSEGFGLGGGKEGSMSPPGPAGLGFAALASQPAHYSTLPPQPIQLQPPQPISTYVTPPMPTNARFAPQSPTRTHITPTPSPPRAFSLDYTPAPDATMGSSPPRSPPRRPIASIPPPSPGAALRALPLAVERLRSPGMGHLTASTEGKSLRRTSSLRRSSSLAPDPDGVPSPAPSSSPNPSLELDDIPMRPARSSYDLSPHRVYVASLDDSDDEGEGEGGAAGRPGSPVILPPGAGGAGGLSLPLPYRPLPQHLLPPTSLPPGQGALTLYRPLTFGKAKEEGTGRGQEWEEFMRARQVEEVEGMGRSDTVGDSGMEEEIVVGDADGMKTPGSEGMEMDLDG